MQLNVDQIKMDLQSAQKVICKQMAVIDLIERSQQRAREIACSSYYTVFGTLADRIRAIEKQNKVTSRLVNYLGNLRRAY